MTCISYTSLMHFWGGFLPSAQRRELIFVSQCSCHLLYCLYISFNVNVKSKILTKLEFALWVCPTFGEIIQQNRKSPSSVLTAHNNTGNRTFMCNKRFGWPSSVHFWPSSVHFAKYSFPRKTFLLRTRKVGVCTKLWFTPFACAKVFPFGDLLHIRKQP